MSLTEKPDLVRQLGLWDGVAIVAGTVIGGGIFLVPNLVARQLTSPSWILGAWLFAGVLSFFGALAYAELGAMMPATGGQYVYLREIYGSMVAFLCGWTFFVVVLSGAIAWITTSFAIYLGHFLPLAPVAQKVVAIALIGVLAAVNATGTRRGAGFQKLTMALKLAAIGALILLGLRAPVSAAAPVAPLPVTVTAFGAALVACLLTYDGWIAASFIAG